MTNKEIARTFQFLGNIMELHGENPFKIRSYQNAYIQLRKLPQPLAELPEEELAAIKGVGKAISGKIRELVETGRMETLERYRAQTPEGVQEMLAIKGFGPKKVRVVWKDLGVETIGELLYAVNENRLLELKGFGPKTQEELKRQLEYYQRSKDKFHWAALEAEAVAVRDHLRERLPGVQVEWAGAWRRGCNVVERIEVLVGAEGPLPEIPEGLVNSPLTIYQCAPEAFGSRWFRHTGSAEFLEAFVRAFPGKDFRDLATEEAVFQRAGLPHIAPELREGEWALERAIGGNLPVLIEASDIRGVVHAHSTYSDGLHSLREMAEAARSKGYSYLAITDHSQSAFYANGLKPERVREQWEEIDRLNREQTDFRILKGIESDILSDGSLDYEDELLKGFDLIIASIHSNLRMDREKATQRLIKAVENPYTSLLGHPTGRLLLSREGYPIDHQAVIDACAANGVGIELNANPYRLDLDWSWIPYALEKEVKISVNPDAHSTGGIDDIRFGCLSARKGGLSREACLNAWPVEEFLRRVKR